ncbi:putative mfs multidrug transporter protein [Neofusicoccum parvum UCRNP2]|uniref:Putative mfs multidrug transporter protein n=1 Tax=Botryosphaeria parva (strain UCR-NP2) TaxID=1287680 RepID=R1EBZ0_BOTPV|nr:putative mfs multidrug transporter protein [Neofusicoccum parvum UCRNP2]
MEKDLNTSNTIGVMILSIYMLAFSVVPLITSPLSEMYGRLVVLQGSNAFFLIFNTACGFAKTPGQLLAFRFLSGIGGAVMGEMFTPLERGQAVSIYSIAPLLGPVVGPVCGGLLAQHASGAACLRETYPPVLLRRKRDALAAATGNERLRTEYGGDRDWTGLLGRSMERPFRMLATQPIVQAVSLYAGYGYGLAFLLSATMPLVWEGLYGQPPSTASLNYLPSSIGVVVMSQVTPRLGDAVYGRLLARALDGQGRPEFRVPLLFVAGVLTPVGLLWVSIFDEQISVYAKEVLISR